VPNLESWATARNSFEAGKNETMISYVSRRRRWYEMLKNLDKAVELSQQMRGEWLLGHANLFHNQKLMGVTSTFNDLSCARIAEALIKQHALALSIKAPEKYHSKRWP
jgi:hypothetical protein